MGDDLLASSKSGRDFRAKIHYNDRNFLSLIDVPLRSKSQSGKAKKKEKKAGREEET